MKRLVVCVALMLGLLTLATAQQFTQWSAPVNMGPGVNSPSNDWCLTVSKNGLSLFFRSNRSGLSTLWVSRRASVDDPWGMPQLIPNFNDGYSMSCPALSPDEHRMFFISGRSPNCGPRDIWVSRRHDRNDDFGWQPPVNLGCEPNGPNSMGDESTPTVFEDETGTEVLYFGGPGGIRQSRMRPDGTFGPSTLVTELLPGGSPAVRRDGLEIIFASNRPGGPYPPTVDLWTSTRASTALPWSMPVPLPVLSSSSTESARMCFSFDGRTFYFNSDRPGGYGSFDLWYATREKLRQ